MTRGKIYTFCFHSRDSGNVKKVEQKVYRLHARELHFPFICNGMHVWYMCVIHVEYMYDTYICGIYICLWNICMIHMEYTYEWNTWWVVVTISLLIFGTELNSGLCSESDGKLSLQSIRNKTETHSSGDEKIRQKHFF